MMDFKTLMKKVRPQSRSIISSIDAFIKKDEFSGEAAKQQFTILKEDLIVKVVEFRETCRQGNDLWSLVKDTIDWDSDCLAQNELLELSKYRFEKKWNEFLELEVIIDASVETSSIVKDKTEGIETLTGIKDELPDFIDDEKNNSDNSKDTDNIGIY